MTTRKPAKSLPANSASADVKTISATDVTEQIRAMAYALYEQRGKQEGFAEQDWLQAEAEILGSQRTFKAAA